MKRNIVKLNLLGLMFLLIGNVYASNEKNIEVKDRPVDDAIKTIVKEDTIKGGDKLQDSYHEEKISLSTIDKIYQIKRDNLYFPPYRCFIYHKNEKITEIGIINDSKIDFQIKKSLLSEGDYILVTSNLKVKGNPFGKFVVEEIEVLKF